MKSVVVCDDTGGVLLSRFVRKQYGCEFHLVFARAGVVLVSVSKVSLGDFARIGKWGEFQNLFYRH